MGRSNLSEEERCNRQTTCTNTHEKPNRSQHIARNDHQTCKYLPVSRVLTLQATLMSPAPSVNMAALAFAAPLRPYRSKTAEHAKLPSSPPRQKTLVIEENCASFMGTHVGRPCADEGVSLPPLQVRTPCIWFRTDMCQPYWNDMIRIQMQVSQP
jgi:hypothetical protein